MSHHDDRSPLMLKVAMRQALRRIRDEADAFSQYEALAGNLGWEDVSAAAAEARGALAEAAERAADAVEAAVRLQAEAAIAHEYDHAHSHTHQHEHPHSHGHE